MSKVYIIFLLFVLSLGLFITKFYGYNACIDRSDKTDSSLCQCDYDYHVNISDEGTTIYSTDGKFVDYLPFDSSSNWDKAMLKDNL